MPDIKSTLFSVLEAKFNITSRPLDKLTVFYPKDTISAKEIKFAIEFINTDTISVAFTPACTPSQVAMVTWELGNYGLSVMISEEFYFKDEKTVLWGKEAIELFMSDRQKDQKVQVNENEDILLDIQAGRIFVSEKPVNSTYTPKAMLIPHLTFKERMLQDVFDKPRRK